MGFIGESIASNPIAETKIYFTSRFILWDENEKMIDNHFQIHIHFKNETLNDTAYYNIRIDDLIYNGTFQYYESISINITDKQILSMIDISINNRSIYTVYGVTVISGVTKSNIERSISEFLISLNPLEWKEKEWNIFFAVIVASILTIPIALRFVKYFRAKRGVSEVK